MTEEDYRKDIERLTKELKSKDEDIKYMQMVLRAYGNVEKMTTQELIEKEETIKTQSKLSDFSERELRLRDEVLRTMLEINKNISSILDEQKLLEKVLEGLITSLKAQRGVMFFYNKGKTEPVIFNNINADELNQPYFQFCLLYIDEVARYRKPVYRLFEELEISGKMGTLSFVCLPLLYEDRLMGIVYVDIISEDKTFRIQDQDIADLFCSQAAISMNNASLYQKIKEQNLELMKLVNLKDQLMNEVSKKLKKPLEEVAKLLNKISQGEGCKDETVKADMDRMTYLVQQSEKTVVRVLTIQELEREVEDLYSDEVDFNALFDFILDFYKEEVKKRNITVSVDMTEHFRAYHGNRQIMRTIFEELISNAIFYNRVNGKIEIRGYKQGDYLMVDIIDTGHGIKKGDIHNVFEQFYRTESSPTLNEKGAGLGLFLVRKFLRYYNGDVSVESTYGVGSKFSARLLLN